MSPDDGASGPPAYLVQLLRRGCGADGWVARRCQRHLPTVWRGLQEYTGDPLATPLAWDARVTPVVMQRWYAAYGSLPALGHVHLRWVRYTLNRLLLVAAGAPGAPGTIRPLRIVTAPGGADRRIATHRLRLPAHQEEVVTAVLEASAAAGRAPATKTDRYCLRRFVATLPVWRAADLLGGGLAPDAVEWWLRWRLAEAVPAAHRPWFPEALRQALARHGAAPGHHGPPPPRPAPHRRTVPLHHHPAEEVEAVGGACALFFRHYFAQDEVPTYVRRLQERLSQHALSLMHGRQVWEFVRAFWLHHAPAPGVDLATEAVPRVTVPSVWEWLQAVYRRQGGGAWAAGGQARGGGPTGALLPSACSKALTAAQHVLRDLGWGGGQLPRRAELRRRLVRLATLEEPLRPRAPPPGPRGRRTYTHEECRRLLAACPGDARPRDRLMLLLLQRVALRNRALRQLLLRDVLEDRERAEPRRVGEALEKGGVVRRFPLDPETRDALRRYYAEEYLRTVTVPWCFHTACLFPSSPLQPERPMTPSQVHHWFRSVARRAGVHGPHVTLHQFRHYLVTSLMPHGPSSPPPTCLRVIKEE